MRSHAFHIQTTQDVLNFIKGPDQSYSALKFGDNLSSRNRDMAQNVILQLCDLEGSRSSVKVKKFSIRPPLTTCKFMCEVSSKSYGQFFCYSIPIIDQKVARKRKKDDRNTLTHVDSCDASYAMKERSDVK